MEEKKMTCQEAGRLGAKKLKETCGAEHFRLIGAKGGAAVKAKYSREHFVALGKKGGAKIREALAAFDAKQKGEK